MREYLFRGKRKDNGEWVYWNIYGEFCTPKGRRIRLIIKTPYGEKYYHYIHEIKQLIDPETIGQYTGLTDKNGKKIFEGDILDGLCGLHIVYFDDSLACFDWESATGKQSESFSGFADDYKIISNIHDNPEILKGGDGNG